MRVLLRNRVPLKISSTLNYPPGVRSSALQEPHCPNKIHRAMSNWADWKLVTPLILHNLNKQIARRFFYYVHRTVGTNNHLQLPTWRSLICSLKPHCPNRICRALSKWAISCSCFSRDSDTTSASSPDFGTTRRSKAFILRLPRSCRRHPSMRSCSVTTSGSMERPMARRREEMMAFLMKPPVSCNRRSETSTSSSFTLVHLYARRQYTVSESLMKRRAIAETAHQKHGKGAFRCLVPIIKKEGLCRRQKAGRE
jgi:hypothetical protein